MSSIQSTLRQAREVEEKYKQLMARKVESDKSLEETLKRIDQTQETLAESKETIGSIEKMYDQLFATMNQSIDQAVASIQKNTLLAVAEPGFEPKHVNTQRVAEMLKEKKKIMILTGAGISAASGIPTFRGEEGFWSKEAVQVDPEQPFEKINPQVLLTNAFYSKHPKKTWEWLIKFSGMKAKAKPNKGHLALAEIIQALRSKGKEVCIVTQNIDNFHTQAKLQRVSKNKNMRDYPIYEIHGNILKIRCTQCSLKEEKLCVEPFECYLDILEMSPSIYCPKCEALLRPHIMFFDECYQQTFNHSDSVNSFFEGTDAILAIGTTLQTGLANTLVSSSLDRDIQIVEINPTCQIKKAAVWWMERPSEQVLESLRMEMLNK